VNGLLVAKDQSIQDCEVLYLIYFLGIVFGGVIITGGSGSGASAICTIDVNGGINNVTITNNGSGYTSAPDVIVPPPGEGEGYDTAILQAVISSGSSSSSPSASFQQVADNDPKLILLK
jgi:hypothetical protein